MAGVALRTVAEYLSNYKKNPNDVLRTTQPTNTNFTTNLQKLKNSLVFLAVPILPKKNVEFTWHFFLPKKKWILNRFQLQKPDPPTSKIPAAKANVTNHGHNTQPINE